MHLESISTRNAPVAQPVERVAVNHKVVSSSLTRGV